MIAFVVLVALAVWNLLRCRRGAYFHWTVGDWAFGLALSAFGLFVAFIFLSAIRPRHVEVWDRHATREMVALANGATVDGRIGGGVFVVSGYIQGSEQYRFMVRDGGGLSMGVIPYSRGKVFECDSPVSPREEVLVSRIVGDSYDLWLSPCSMADTPGREFYNLFVPRGTVARGFSVDVNK